MAMIPRNPFNGWINIENPQNNHNAQQANNQREQNNDEVDQVINQYNAIILDSEVEKSQLQSELTNFQKIIVPDLEKKLEKFRNNNGNQSETIQNLEQLIKSCHKLPTLFENLLGILADQNMSNQEKVEKIQDVTTDIQNEIDILKELKQCESLFDEGKKLCDRMIVWYSIVDELVNDSKESRILSKSNVDTFHNVLSVIALAVIGGCIIVGEKKGAYLCSRAILGTLVITTTRIFSSILLPNEGGKKRLQQFNQ